MSICEHNLELLSDFLDGTLDAARAVGLSKHLDSCSYCRAEHHALRNTIGMLQAAATPDGSSAQRLALMNMRRTATVEPVFARRSFAGLRLAAATLAAATLAALTIQVGPRPSIDSGVIPPLLAATTLRSHTLPTSFELDEMASLHAVHSFAVSAGDAGDQQETLADATSRLH